MKYRGVFLILLSIVFLFSCSSPKPRRPKKHNTQNFYTEIVQKNKKLNSLEKKKIELWLTQDTIHNYTSSTKGYWYRYIKQDSIEKRVPKLEETVKIKYDISDLQGNIIYPEQERLYTIDKEDFIPALQDGIKWMKKGEIITFVIPSYSAYGVTGDGNRIGINQSIQSRVTLIDIK